MPKPPASDADLLVDNENFPGRDWMSQYLRHIEEEQKDFKASSHRAYESVWRAFLVFLAQRALDPLQAKAEHVAAFLAGRQQSTALRYARLLKRVYARQIETKTCTNDPFVKLPSLLASQEKRETVAAVSITKVEEIIRALPAPNDWQEHRDQAIVVLAAAAGLRLRELRELHAVQLVPRSHGLEVQPRGRTVTSREIPLDPAAAKFMSDWLEVRSALIFQSSTHLAFPGRKGQALPVNTLYRRVRRLLETLFGPNALPHFGVGLLRATFAERFRRTDEVVEAQHALGHRRITSTLRYLWYLRPVSPKETA